MRTGASQCEVQATNGQLLPRHGTKRARRATAATATTAATGNVARHHPGSQVRSCIGGHGGAPRMAV
eukprot:CAMPEP_0203930620 /NCGR_PEP_ID=MMETSP0359-20131031/69333_1 /ASSEMBLY_ACC=CAM_ASM_000338 /TAXON_ID=268821 /ORGANISM="Scrippsiella Hangoei, Strain SHTV-5" /LENGTH=66 /DNA_ID=CAMNT_0050859819 /DNA_START=56 /DNA_END=252 /DNA_ORIENTATION=-